MKLSVVTAFLIFMEGALILSVNAQYNVKQYGAKGDGRSLDSNAIQAAINDAYKNGGGIVEIPSGTYIIGTLILKDNVNLHLLAGTVLSGSPNINDYKETDQKFESRTRELYAKYFMIFAEDVKNVSITGKGIINGNGNQYFQESRPQNNRPFMIRLVNSQNITINGISLLESANWTLHLLGCKDVNIDGIVIENSGDGNRDGLDIDACQRVTVANSRFRTTDDAIVMKSSCNILCQDIAITNCILRSGGSAIKTGTESNGGFKNITISNCVIKDIDVHAGIELMTVDGGMLQNVLVENIIMENVATPIFLRAGIRCRPFMPDQYVKKIENVSDIHFNNISVINAKLPSSIMGLHNRKIKNVSLTNYSVRYVQTQQAIPFNKVPFKEFSYPMAIMFKNLPAFGLYCRNVEEIYLENITMYSAEDESRPALTFDRVKNLGISSIKAMVTDQSPAMIHFRNSKNALISSCRSIGKNKALFEQETNTCTDLRFSGNFTQTGQSEITGVEALPDAYSYDDFSTKIKYCVETGENLQGQIANDLKTPLKFSMDITKRGSLQLCLLMLNNSPLPKKVLIKYDGITQEFIIDWNTWGWAPITLLKEYPNDTNVNFEIVPSLPGSDLKISKVYLRYQDIEFTD